MLGDNLLRQGNSYSTIEGWFAIKGEEELTFVERPRIESQSTDLDHHMTVVGGSGNGEFTPFLHASYGVLDYGTKALLHKMSIQLNFG